MLSSSNAAPAPGTSAAAAPITFQEALRVWVRVGAQSFGGPAGQIAVMHRILVEEKKWVSESRFLHALNYCMLLPGPEAQQLATYLGWLLHGYRGGLTAGLLFVAPGFVSILGLSYFYAATQGVGLVAGLFFGLKAAVLAVVVEAVVRMGRRILKNRAMIGLSAAAFIGIFFFGLPFPLIVVGAGLIGFFGGVYRPETFIVIQPKDDETSQSEDARSEQGLCEQDLPEQGESVGLRPSTGRSLRVLAFWMSLWALPIAGLALIGGTNTTYFQEAVFFSKTAAVTFGGAYAVLAYIAQQAVERFEWLAPGEMLDGLGMAETTPGPLIQVVQFVGFMGAFRNPGGLDPWLAGTLGALITTWATFVPCFLWIFLGAPYIEWLRGNQRLSAALSAITAAVVGVILNLAVWFFLHVLFSEVREVAGPFGTELTLVEWSSLNPLALVIALAAMIAMLRFRVKMLPVLGVAAAVGASASWIGS